MRPERGTSGAGREGAFARSSRPPRPAARRAALVAASVLLASVGRPLLAGDGSHAASGLSGGAFGEVCPFRRGVDGATDSFGLGDGALRNGSVRPAFSLEPPARFSLCEGPGAVDVAETSRVLWTPSPAPDPTEPLRGVRNATAPHGRRLLRSSVILTGTAIASGAILSLLPKEETNWEEGAFDHGFSNLGRAWTSLPVWDRDEAFHDWFGHPYAGAFYYNMLRSQGATVGQSFAYCVFQSAVWEYVLEAAAEQPSIQDLVSTPFIGAVLGELFHRWSIAILRKGRPNLGEKALVFLLNPSYVINNGYRAPE